MKPNQTGNPTRSGFTLIELLVVVAIIALLISILLPSMSGARQQSKQLLCLTHLHSMGQAALFYSQQYNDWLIGNESQEGAMPKQGLPLDYPRDDSYAHTQFAISLLKGLLYDYSEAGLYYSGNQKAMLDACRRTPQFQCPTHPVPAQALDYIVNAFTLPYTKLMADYDVAGGGKQGSGYTGQFPYYVAFFHQLTRMPAPLATGRVIYVTEGHISLPTENLIFHDVFYTSALPFGAFPRIASDPRHPGGINALFFDGHAETMRHDKMDAGWPNSIGLRLKWFTLPPKGYE